MKHVYRKLRVEEISSVDKGASPGARVTFWKRDSAMEKSMPPNLDAILGKLSDDEKKVVLEAIAAKGPAAPVAPPHGAPAGPPQPAAHAAPTHPQPAVLAAPALAPQGAPAAPGHQPAPQTEAEREQQLMKNLPESVKKQLAEATEWRERVAKMEEENLSREYLAKAEALPFIPQLSKGEIADVLKMAERGRPLTKELGAKLMKSLRSINEVLAGNKSFEEVGSGGEGSDDPSDKIETIAKGLRKEDPKLTREQAYAKALEENKHLYREYEAANPPQKRKA